MHLVSPWSIYYPFGVCSATTVVLHGAAWWQNCIYQTPFLRKYAKSAAAQHDRGRGTRVPNLATQRKTTTAKQRPDSLSFSLQMK